MRVELGRRYRLAASHRLFCPEWNEARNVEAFGKCANPHGHGHNYTIEVVLSGEVDQVTGMVFDLAKLDAITANEIVESFDNTNLNLLACFRNKVPTSENFCIEIFGRLQAALPGGLLRQIRLEETANNSFSYSGEV